MLSLYSFNFCIAIAACGNVLPSIKAAVHLVSLFYFMLNMTQIICQRLT